MRARTFVFPLPAFLLLIAGCQTREHPVAGSMKARATPAPVAPGTPYMSVETIDARVDSIDRYAEANPGQRRLYAIMPDSARLIPVRDSTAWPSGLESSVNILTDSSGRLLMYAKVPSSESGDWFAQIVHYFAPDGRVILWKYDISAFGAGCTDLLREHRRMYLQPSGGTLKDERRYTDSEDKVIAADKCYRRSDSADPPKRTASEFRLP